MEDSYLPTSSPILLQKRMCGPLIIALLQAVSLCLSVLCMAKPVLGNETPIVKSIVITEKNTFSRVEGIHPLMKTKIGDNYDAEKLEKDFATIARLYQENGFTYARIDTKENPVKQIGNDIHIGIILDKGTIGEITLDGIQHTDEDVIRRELLFEIGDAYTKDDAEESEQILRQKAYIGAAKITSQWDAESEKVMIHVRLTEDWSPPLPSFNPTLNKQSGTFLLGIRQSNVFGSGHDTEVRYRRVSEIGEKTRSFLTWQYKMPRLFHSHWNFEGAYIQQREGDSWAVVLERPQYTLKSRWSARFSLSESIGYSSWYKMGTPSDRFETSLYSASARIRRYFGDRDRQNYIGLWTNSRRSRHVLIEKLHDSIAAPSNRDIKLVGITLGRKRVNYQKTQFIRRMGREENFFVGSEYAFSLGHASPFYGSDTTESYASIVGKSGWTRGEKILGTAVINLSTYFTKQIERSTLEVRTAWYYKDIFNTGDDIYTVTNGFRKEKLFDFHQTFVAEFKTGLEFGYHGESQVLLGSFNGLRGYDYRQFNGEKMMLLRLESRTIFGGRIFAKIDDMIASAATFCAKPFVNHPIRLGLVLGGTVFADVGYIWNGQHTFDIRQPKRSVGFEMRGAFAKVSNAGIIRIQFAFPLDPPFSPSLKPRFDFGLQRAF